MLMLQNVASVMPLSFVQQRSSQANVQRRSSKGKGTGGKSRLAASSQVTSVFGEAQQRQARTVDRQTVPTGSSSKGKGKARDGAFFVGLADAVSSAHEYRKNKVHTWCSRFVPLQICVRLLRRLQNTPVNKYQCEPGGFFQCDLS